jgi:antitoxin MazE
MDLKIIKVGNSKGLRLPKAIIEEYNIEGTVELKLKKGYIEIRPKEKPRINWKKDFEKITSDPNEERLFPDFFEDEEI